MLSKVLSRTLSRQPEADSKEDRRRSSSSSRDSKKHIPQGRGGAGNVSDLPAPNVSAEDLRTPTIKSDFYTTGRGGTGNMTKNTDPEDARRAQDVVSHPRMESNPDVHVGRGGAANIAHLSNDEVAAARRENAAWEAVVAEERRAVRTPAGFAERGRKWLVGLREGKGAKGRPASERLSE